MAGRPESPLEPGDGPLHRFAFELRELRAKAGSPTYREMAARTGAGASTLSQAAGGERLPTLPTVLAYVRACEGDCAMWEQRWRQAARDVTEEPRPEEDDADAPYRGLQRFEPGDHDLFFGREALTEQLVAKVRDHRLVAVVGASGSGKSSLLRAGLIPALRAGQAIGPGPAAIRIFTPGAHPYSTRSGLLAPAPAGDGGGLGGDTVVVIDQFEELFTLGADPAERAAFLERLAAGCTPGSRLRAVIAVRADFFGRCADHPGLAQHLREATLLVGPMSLAELRQAVVRPATAAGLFVERELTAQILQDVADQPGGLPLMSHALLETWRRRRGRTLTPEMYQAAGGLHGAITKTAEAAYSRLSPTQAAVARGILLRLITPGDGTPDTRRPAARTELLAVSTHSAQVLDALARARLITVDDDIVDLAHEALISAWPRYRAWIDDSRERLRTHRRLTEAAAAWNEWGQDPGALYRGARLAAAEETFTEPEHRAGLTPQERSFLDASSAGRDLEVRAAVRATRRLRSLTAILSVLLMLAVAAGATAWDQSRTSQQQRQAADLARGRAVAAQRIAQSRQLAARSDALINTDPDLASLLAVQAYRTSPTTEANASLESAAALPLQRRLHGQTPDVSSLAFSSNGRSLVSGSYGGQVVLWDVTSGRLHSILSHSTMPVAAVAFTNAATAGADRVLVSRWNGKLELRSPATAPPRLLDTNPLTGTAHMFSADGRTLAIGDGHGTVDVRDVQSGHERSISVHTTVNSLALSKNGRSLAVGGDRSVTVWDVASGDREHNFTVSSGARSVALSEDGRVIAATTDDGRIHTWGAASDRQRPTVRVILGPVQRPEAVALSPDGQTLAVADGRAVRWWDLASGQERPQLTGHTADIESIAFSPDGRMLASGDDHTIRLWNVASAHSWYPGIHGLTVASSDGHLVNYSASASAVTLRDFTAGRTWSIPGSWSTVNAYDFSPDGQALAVATAARVAVIDTASGRTQTIVTHSIGKVALVRLGPAGRIAVIEGSTGSLQTWDVRAHRVLATQHQQPPDYLALSPDGHALATLTDNGTLILKDPLTLRSRITLDTRIDTQFRPAEHAAFSSDGRTLAARAIDGAIHLWDTGTGRTRTVLPTPADETTTLAFGPGDTLAVTTPEGALQVWDTGTNRIRASLPGIDAVISSPAFTPGGHALVTDGRYGTALWDLALPTPDQAVHRVCRALGRDFTPQERVQYLPDQPTIHACA